MDPVQFARQTFAERIQTGRVLGWAGYSANRATLAWILALAPATALWVSILLAPPGWGRAVTDPQHVTALFARLLSAIATAATIAVSVAALTLSRELKGVKEQEERHQADLDYRARIRRAAGLAGAPLPLSAFVAVALRNVADRAAAARRVATPADLDAVVESARLGDYLDALEDRARLVADRLDEARSDPHLILDAALDFEMDMTSHLAHAYERHGDLSAGTRAAMGEVSKRLRDHVIGFHYAKTLDIQWGLSRMAIFIAVSSLPAIVASALMALGYTQGAVDAWGLAGAGALVAAAFALALLPVTAFVAYIMRFLLQNEHTLPTEGFVLGPEAHELTRGPRVTGKRKPSG